MDDDVYVARRLLPGASAPPSDGQGSVDHSRPPPAGPRSDRRDAETNVPRLQPGGESGSCQFAQHASEAAASLRASQRQSPSPSHHTAEQRRTDVETVLHMVSGSRGPTQIHIRGLCHWAGDEPAGHLGAESPSRRTARPASARKTSSPCPHWLRGLSQTHHVNAVSRHRRVPLFASSRRPLTRALAHLQWQEPPRFIDASATSRASIKEPSPSRGPTTRPLRASPRHP